MSIVLASCTCCSNFWNRKTLIVYKYMCIHSNYCTYTYTISSLLWFLDTQVNSHVHVCTYVCVSLHVNLNTFQGNIYLLAIGYVPSSQCYQWLVVVVVYRTRLGCWRHSSYWWDHSLNHPKGCLYGRTEGRRKQIWSTAPHSQCQGAVLHICFLYHMYICAWT